MWQTKRLYMVSVSFSFPVLAETPSDAFDYLDESIHDLMANSTLEKHASVARVTFSEDGKPELGRYDAKATVYGAGSKLTLEDAFVEERRLFEMDSRQMKLF